MYKAKNKSDDSDVIILDPRWRAKIDLLRAHAAKDMLVCQGCGQPVLVRSGQVRRPHFAHKTLKDCTYGHDSPELLLARAVLYEYLQPRYGAAVTVEKQVEGLPRPVDCWVESQAGTFAYWIIEGGMKPDKRSQLSRTFYRQDVPVTWVLLDQPKREQKAEKIGGSITLTTTERDFLADSAYDEVAAEKLLRPGRTLHFLNAETRQLHTFRGLHVIHEPAWYLGIKRSSLLSDVQVVPVTGEFLHPGEAGELQAVRERAVQARQQRRQLQTRETSPALADAFQGNFKQLTLHVGGKRHVFFAPTQAVTDQRSAVCLVCDRETTNWVYFDVTASKCICNQCLQGKYPQAICGRSE